MPDDTLIADLIHAGVSPELVGRVANAIAMSGTMSGTSAGAVRQYERDRKQEWRNKRRELQAKPEANDAGQPSVAGATMSRTVPDSVTNNDSLFRDSMLLEKKERVSQRSKNELVERVRGTRITRDWRPTEADWQFAIDHGVSDVKALRAEFIDYWIAVPGQRGLKTDWSATWRNRVRQVGTGKVNGASHGKRRNSAKDAADDLIARAESFEREVGLGPVIDAEPGGQGGKADHR